MLRGVSPRFRRERRAGAMGLCGYHPVFFGSLLVCTIQSDGLRSSICSQLTICIGVQGLHQRWDKPQASGIAWLNILTSTCSHRPASKLQTVSWHTSPGRVRVWKAAFNTGTWLNTYHSAHLLARKKHLGEVKQGSECCAIVQLGSFSPKVLSLAWRPKRSLVKSPCPHLSHHYWTNHGHPPSHYKWCPSSAFASKHLTALGHLHKPKSWKKNCSWMLVGVAQPVSAKKTSWAPAQVTERPFGKQVQQYETRSHNPLYRSSQCLLNLLY